MDSALTRSALEQAAYEEMARRESWDKEYENSFHLLPQNDTKKEEDRRRASWNEDYCNLLVPVYGSCNTSQSPPHPLSRHLDSMGSWISQKVYSRLTPCLSSKSIRWLPEMPPASIPSSITIDHDRNSGFLLMDGICSDKFVF